MNYLLTKNTPGTRSSRTNGVLSPYSEEKVMKTNYIYIAAKQGGEQPWKIGKTVDPLQRLKGLQTGSPVPLEFVKVVEAHPDLERSLHRHFSKHRASGEWFNLPPEAAQEVLERLDGKMVIIKLKTTTGSQQRPEGKKKYHPPKPPWEKEVRARKEAREGRKTQQPTKPCGCGALYSCRKHRNAVVSKRAVMATQIRTDRPVITSTKKPRLAP